MWQHAPRMALRDRFHAHVHVQTLRRPHGLRQPDERYARPSRAPERPGAARVSRRLKPQPRRHASSTSYAARRSAQFPDGTARRCPEPAHAHTCTETHTHRWCTAFPRRLAARMEQNSRARPHCTQTQLSARARTPRGVRAHFTGGVEGSAKRHRRVAVSPIRSRAPTREPGLACSHRGSGGARGS